MQYRYIDTRGEHLHTLDGKPLIGTSTVTKILSKPLTWWAAGKALEGFGWVNPKFCGTSERLAAAASGREAVCALSVEQYAARLQEGYRAHDNVKNKAAKSGTDLHGELESWVDGCLTMGGKPDSEVKHAPECKPFVSWALENVEKFVWSEVNLYDETLWVGGISDAGAVLKGGKLAIIDFKSSKEAYFDQFVQVGGYATQFEANGGYDADGNKTIEAAKIDALVIFPFGGGSPRIEYDVESYQRAFIQALGLYKLKEKYESSTR